MKCHNFENESTQRLSCQPEPLSNHEQPTAWENSSPIDRYNTSKCRDRLFSTMFLMAPLQRCPPWSPPPCHSSAHRHCLFQLLFPSNCDITMRTEGRISTGQNFSQSMPRPSGSSHCSSRSHLPLHRDGSRRSLYLLPLRPSCSTFPKPASLSRHVFFPNTS